jgi:hypothetical protein
VAGDHLRQGSAQDRKRERRGDAQWANRGRCVRTVYAG